MISVHQHASRVLQNDVLPRLAELKIAEQKLPSGVRILDFGAAVPGGWEAGRLLAELCMGGLARVKLARHSLSPTGTGVEVWTDFPLQACLGAQYAGWPISDGDYFAMGSGPFRAARGKEKVLEELGLVEEAKQTIGILETKKTPSDEVAQRIAAACRVDSAGLTLAIAPTSCLAGMIQIVARSVETCLHKLHELHIPLSPIVSACGFAPLPPATSKDRIAMGWTNDCVLYGAQVTLWWDGPSVDWQTLGPQIPSSASSDYGRPFGEIFEAYGRDFYRIDPLLFSPAQVTIVDRASGKTWTFGAPNSEILKRAFEG